MSDDGQNSIENVQAALRQLLQKQKEAASSPRQPVAEAPSLSPKLFTRTEEKMSEERTSSEETSSQAAVQKEIERLSEG
ncbi:hypothetical protein LOC54_01810 [Acetobacter sp. AN02]|uniref:hypothetical protein n=1 Tax=Acetobacter sp. AN02 TaxID=2894186 RepID=UPI002434309F|nr:hypothetical protein [Acetobacter sp. AN02]MDG6093859.1 hypothetical protein [Acetobacter sp. AN02]